MNNENEISKTKIDDMEIEKKYEYKQDFEIKINDSCSNSSILK